MKEEKRKNQRNLLITTLAGLVLFGMSCIKAPTLGSEINQNPRIPAASRKANLEEVAIQQPSPIIESGRYRGPVEIPSNYERLMQDEIDSYIATAINLVKPEGIVDHMYIRATIRAESEEDPNATSNMGARGYMQLIPPTWRALTQEFYGTTLPLTAAHKDLQANITIGTYYLNKIWKGFADKYGTQFTDLPEPQQRAVVSFHYLAGPGNYVLGNPSRKEQHWHAEKVERKYNEFREERGI